MATEVPLDTLQRWMQTFIVHRGTEDEALAAAAGQGISVDDVPEVILPSKTLTSVERVGVYRGMYLLRLQEALEADYPAVAHFVGDDAFYELVADYVDAYPSRSYSLNYLGDHFPEFIRTARGMARREFLYDLARLELAFEKSFDAPETPVLTTDQIEKVPAGAWETARFEPIAAFRLLELSYPASEYLTSVKEENHKHPAIRKKLNWVAISRRNYACYRAELSRPAFDLLKSLAAGEPMGKAVATAARALKRRGGMKEDQLFRWFRDWVSQGMFQSVEVEP